MFALLLLSYWNSKSVTHSGRYLALTSWEVLPIRALRQRSEPFDGLGMNRANDALVGECQIHHASLNPFLQRIGIDEPHLHGSLSLGLGAPR